MTELVQRLVTGIIFVAALLFPIYLGPLYGTIIIGILCLLTIVEYLKIQGLSGVALISAVILSIIMYFALAILVATKGIVPTIKYAILLSVAFCGLLFYRFLRKEDPFSFRFQVLPATLYISIPLALLMTIGQWDGTYRPGILLAILSFVWINDIMAYLIGRFFGKHPFAPTISPKKTWEGTLAGWISCLVAAYIFHLLITGFSLIQWMLLGGLIALAGTYGDLIESIFKRKKNIKDSGVFLPGHGGLLDRLDALLFSLPMAALLFLIWSL